MVVTFWGGPKRRTSNVWIHQCGSVREALAAREAGADAVIAQGVEAGGHVRGTMPTVELLARAIPPLLPRLLCLSRQRWAEPSGRVFSRGRDLAALLGPRACRAITSVSARCGSTGVRRDQA